MLTTLLPLLFLTTATTISASPQGSRNRNDPGIWRVSDLPTLRTYYSYPILSHPTSFPQTINVSQLTFPHWDHRQDVLRAQTPSPMAIATPMTTRTDPFQI